MISPDELLQPISNEQPCGEDLSYDPGLQQLETLVQGTPETQFGAAEDPNWKQLHKEGLEVFARSKDLRVAIILCLTSLKLDGFAGLAAGLSLIRGMLEQYWEPLYPRLDPDDNNDPTERINIINNLGARVATFGDPYRFIERIKQLPLCSSPSIGKATMSDIILAKTPKQPSEEGEESTSSSTLNMAQIDAMFRDTNPDVLQENHGFIAQSHEASKAIDVFLNTTLGAGCGANLNELISALDEMKGVFVAYFSGTTGEVLSDGEPGSEARVEGGPMTSTGGARSTMQISGTIQSRADVLIALDGICQFYKQAEPSSPVPFLLQRARKLVNMNFMEIVGDLTPDAITSVKMITGETEGEGG